MLPPLGVVSSLNISDRFHPSVESKVFLRRFKFGSHKRSRILVGKESSEAKLSLLSRKVLNLILARRDFLDDLDRSPYGLQHLASFLALTLLSLTKFVIDAQKLS